MKTRMEADSIGTLEVPSDAYYGVQSLSLIHISFFMERRLLWNLQNAMTFL